MFITRKGTLGFGPSNLEEGDKLWVLRGGKVPFILRSKKEEAAADHFALVGPAYAHGIMFGEALKDEDSSSAVSPI